MNPFDNMVISQSADNVHLLIYILVLSYVLFLPYVGFLTGSVFYSLVLNILGRKQDSAQLIYLSKELVDRAAFNKSAPFILGLIPLLAAMLAYSQIFHSVNISIVGYLVTAFILLSAAFIFIYYYKYTFRIDTLFNFEEDVQGAEAVIASKKSGEISSFIESNLRMHKITGAIGLLLILLSAYMVITSIQFSLDSLLWKKNISVLKLFFSYNTVIKFCVFFFTSLAMTSSALLFFHNNSLNVGLNKPESTDFARKFTLVTGIVTVIALPFFILADLLATPHNSLSGTIFIVSALIGILLFIAAHLFYAMLKESSTKYSSLSFYIIILVFILLIVNTQSAFNHSSQEQRVVLAANFEAALAKEKAAHGQVAAVNGQEIFEGRCNACHRFDQKLVGPAYKNVLPKYEGKMNDLVAFILNPTKKDPNFPPMPNPGIKQNEAKAVADYIMATYKTK